MYTEIFIPGKRIVFTDDVDVYNEEKPHNTCIITTIDSGITDADGYIENADQLSELSDEYLSRIWDRHNKIPHVIFSFPMAGGELILREIGAEDYEAYLSLCVQGGYGIFGKEEEFENEYREYEKASDEEKREIREFFAQNTMEHYLVLDCGLYMAYHGNTPIALAGVMPEKDGVYLGYIVDREYRNKGLATFLCKRILSYINEELGDFEIKAKVKQDNLPSRRVIEKLNIKEVLIP